MTREDFSIEKRASGWAVVRSDGFLVAIGFDTKKDASDWWNKESTMVGPRKRPHTNQKGTGTMPSNLPPGCSSPDGGIDHAMETALETLCNAVETVHCAAVLTALAPVIEKALSDAIRDAVSDEFLSELAAIPEDPDFTPMKKPRGGGIFGRVRR